MNKETAIANIGSGFWLKNEKCEITKVDSFGGVLHFGFFCHTSNGTIWGWIPCDLCPAREW
jgi:hypothetical protein